MIMKRMLLKTQVKKYFMLLSVFIVLMLFIPLTAHADIGPKPSVNVIFTGIKDVPCYGTLLSKVKSTGPASAWDGTKMTARYTESEYEIWKAFVEYEDVDDFYFLQEWWDCSETSQFSWTYYPPATFKILLYFPESDTFYVSQVCERYAFDSYFTADVSDYEKDGMIVRKSYHYTWESISLAVRIVITILLEMAIALLFRYRGKKLLMFIAGVNIITQITLNVLLNIVNYKSGSMAFVLTFILLEIVVFVIEAFVYAAWFWRIGGCQTYQSDVTEKNLQIKVNKKKGKAVLYALTANLASFAVGLWISHFIPGIF